MLHARLLGALVGVKLPGSGTIDPSYIPEFRIPARNGDTITAIFDVESVFEISNRIGMASRTGNQRGAIPRV